MEVNVRFGPFRNGFAGDDVDVHPRLRVFGLRLWILHRAAERDQWPDIFVGLLLTAGMMAYNHWVLPESNFRLRGLLLSIHEQRPMLQIEAGTVTEINDTDSDFWKQE